MGNYPYGSVSAWFYPLVYVASIAAVIAVKAAIYNLADKYIPWFRTHPYRSFPRRDW